MIKADTSPVFLGLLLSSSVLLYLGLFIVWVCNWRVLAGKTGSNLISHRLSPLMVHDWRVAAYYGCEVMKKWCSYSISHICLRRSDTDQTHNAISVME